MAHAGDKPATERRIHVLPVELLERVRSYQNDNSIASEVEAVRRLLSEALQARDTIDDLMKQVRAQFKKDRDFRTLARDILSGHILVKRMEIFDHDLRFVMRSGDAGKIDRQGKLQTGQADEEGNVYNWSDWPVSLGAPTKTFNQATGSWEFPTDLDDDPPPF
ncbi:hypothetical protein GCM10007866_18080 [Gluconobacter albidus]|uniref:Uncharacterized protein n=1 Tax=Gluconobacter albidus TaxID=318683 RepID=A0ABQ5X0S0_9PROT|nr:hypothetical protein AA3250_2173 [Gluconobacter albidus NBRC 3250]GLQ69357.1 hypothetical protein GCM10007866_18080 [Gluconobacter albidus]